MSGHANEGPLPRPRRLVPPRLAELFGALLHGVLRLLGSPFRLAWFIFSGCFHKPFWSWRNWDRHLLFFPWLAFTLFILATAPGARSLAGRGMPAGEIGFGAAFVETIRISPELALAAAGRVWDLLVVAWIWVIIGIARVLGPVLDALG